MKFFLEKLELPDYPNVSFIVFVNQKFEINFRVKFQILVNLLLEFLILQH